MHCIGTSQNREKSVLVTLIVKNLNIAFTLSKKNGFFFVKNEPVILYIPSNSTISDSNRECFLYK